MVIRSARAKGLWLAIIDADSYPAAVIEGVAEEVSLGEKEDETLPVGGMYPQPQGGALRAAIRPTKGDGVCTLNFGVFDRPSPHRILFVAIRPGRRGWSEVLWR